MASNKRHIAILTNPRSLSTALEFSFKSRDDTTIIHEPYAAACCFGTERDREDFPDVPLTPGYTFAEVKQMLESEQLEKPITVWKDTSVFLSESYLDREFYPRHYTPVFLIRDPRYSIPSYREMAISVTSGLDDKVPHGGGFIEMRQIYDWITKEICPDPIVIDAHDLSRHPKEILTAVCEKIGIEFQDSMLHWKQNNNDHWDPVWKCSALLAYADVMQSEGFIPKEEKSFDSSEYPESLRDSILAAVPIYESLYAKRIQHALD